MERLIGLLPLQLARLVGLVRTVTPVPVGPGKRDWVLRVEGYGFRRVLQDDILVAPDLIRPTGWHLPRPRTFFSRAHAIQTACNLGLESRVVAF